MIDKIFVSKNPLYQMWRPSRFLEDTKFDGDSWWFEISLGFRISVRTKLRLKGYRAPEMGNAEMGTIYKDRARELLLKSKETLTRTTGRATYDRWEAEIRLDGYDLLILLTDLAASVRKEIGKP
jgi:hypothetical protein